MAAQKDSSEVKELDISSNSSGHSLIIDDAPTLAPVIIEELDESAITSMDVDITEFVNTEPLEIKEITECPAESLSLEFGADGTQGNFTLEPADDLEETDKLTIDEEDRLTNQFLNGELTFSEYSLRMDQGVETEMTDVEVSRKAFENELAASKRIGNKRLQKTSNTLQKQKRKRRTLPLTLQGLMGEANLRFARGDVTLASQMCMEIIRQVPSAPEPFHTLAMIYENSQPEKSIQFALIAAHLSPNDADQWIRLANLSLDSDNVKQAITCYTKAIQASPKDIELYEIRAKLQEQIGDKKSILKGYIKLLHHLGPEDGECLIRYAKFVAKRYMQDNNYEQALEAMDNIFVKCPELVTLEEVNVMTELLIATKQFHRCLDVLSKYTSIRIIYQASNIRNSTEKENDKSLNDDGNQKQQVEEQSMDERKIESCVIPADVVVDLKAKLLITIIELNEIKIADGLLAKLYREEDPELSGDLFLDVAEALMSKKEFHKALLLLEPLVNSSNYSLAAVWLRHAECWIGCKDLRRAMTSYEIVRKLSPQHLEARLELAKLYKLKGQLNKAIDVLKQDPETDILDAGVIYRRTLLLLKVKRYNEYFQSGILLFSRHCVSLRSKAELTALTKAIGVRHRLDALQLYRLSRGESLRDENAPRFSDDNQPSLKNEFLLFLQICRLACKQKRYGLFERICFSAMTSKRFLKKNSRITFLCLISCIHNNDSYYGYNMVRELVRVCRRSNAWNLLNVVIQRAEDCRHNRFIMRLLGREDVFSYLHILHANNCLVSGTYKYALNDYMSLFKASPSALLALLIGVTLLQMACQKFSAKKNQLVIQGTAFLLKYTQLRGKGGEQEANYNMARAFHQLGMLPTAIHYYKLVLESEPPALVTQTPNLLDLKKEAAFNLHLIYRAAENDYVARIMTLTLASKILFKDICAVFDRISKSPTKRERDEYLKKFIADCRTHGEKIKSRYEDADVSFLPILKLLLPQHVRDRGSYGMKQFALAKLYVRVLCLGKNSADEQRLLHYKSPSAIDGGGDFAEVAFRLLQGRIPARESSMTIEQINAILDRIAENNASNESKEHQFCELIQELNAVEHKWLIRIILKDLRLGISYKKILNAYHPDATDMFDKTMSLQDVCEKLTNQTTRLTYEIELFSSFKPMLLEMCKIEDTEKFFVQNKTYVLQPKHDGERFQIHFKDGQFKYFTRRGYDFTHAYGESASSDNLLSCKIAKLLNPACQSIILDGEMMGWHKTKKRFGSKGMSFDVKKMKPTSFHQPCFIAFDIILYNDELLINKPVTERLKVLEKAFVDEEGVMINSERKTISNRAELFSEFNKSIDSHGEGIVLKISDGTYKSGIRNGSGCYKIKAEYSSGLIEDLDLLIIGGYYGEGRFRGRVNSFLVGVAKPLNDPAEFRVQFHAVCSVRSGISIEMLEDLLQKLQPYWVKECPPDVVGPKKRPDLWIAPQNSIVLKLRASEMLRSSEYPTNYSLRFPRIIAVRDKSEKSWRDCCTSKELYSLIKNPGVIQKLSKRNASISDINDDDKSKSPKKMKQNTISVLDSFFPTTANVVRISHLLDGKQICVLNGNKEMSKEDIEKLVKEHGGNVVANPNATFCVIVGNTETLKVKNAIQSGKYDIVMIDWLLRVTNPNNLAALQSWFPWELVSMSESTKMKLSANFDETFDSYTEDADLESLKRSLEKAEPMITNIELTSEQYKLIDEELFGCKVSPFSIFRGYVGYFTSSNSPRTSMFRFMEGLVSEDLGTSVTHVFLNKRNSPSADIYKRVRDTNPNITILDEQWIADCFKKGELLPETEFSHSTPNRE